MRSKIWIFMSEIDIAVCRDRNYNYKAKEMDFPSQTGWMKRLLQTNYSASVCRRIFESFNFISGMQMIDFLRSIIDSLYVHNLLMMLSTQVWSSKQPPDMHQTAPDIACIICCRAKAKVKRIVDKRWCPAITLGLILLRPTRRVGEV